MAIEFEVDVEESGTDEFVFRGRRYRMLPTKFAECDGCSFFSCRDEDKCLVIHCVSSTGQNYIVEELDDDDDE